MGKPVFITVELPEQDIAQALANYFKRVGWHDIRNNAVDDDEAFEIRDGLALLSGALQRDGYTPR
ncbi:MAG: hypothetical protein KDJ38_00215 [Gammaproteobacteria bacterium]|nr:hypothetical protein [Gammaproteobacteria bacterium]